MPGRVMAQPGERVTAAREERLRVALVSYEYGEVCVALANGLALHADVNLVLPDDQLEEVAPALSPGVRLTPFKKPRLRHPVRQWCASRYIVGEIARFQPDVVHVQQGHLWLNLFGLPRLRRDYPLVLTIHDPSPHVGDRPSRKTPQPLMNLGFRLARQVVVHTKAVRERVVSEVGRPAPDVHVVPHVLIDTRCPDDIVAVDESPGRPTVLFFGRIWPYKGLEHLIRAEPRISAAVPNVEIVIAGSGEPLDRYRSSMVHPGRFKIREGFISRAERSRLFHQASVVVLPYIDATQSGVIPLAYASRRPVVATSVGGLSEMVDDGVTGVLVPPGDEGALADAIVSVLSDVEYAERLGEAGRRKAEADWSPDTVARQTLAVYEQAILEARGPR